MYLNEILVLLLLMPILTLDQYLHTDNNHFIIGYKVIPHPEKFQTGGEDAYYLNPQLIAVADGVGGWNEIGIDPSTYSRELCTNVQKFWKTNTAHYLEKPKDLLIDAAKESKNEGSSTLVLVTIEPEEAILHTAYIGDSGYVVLRKDQNKIKVIYRSKEQQHSFNFPLQIGTNGDDPSEAVSFKLPVEHNDIVIVGSDGLFDNMDSKAISQFVQDYLEEEKQTIDSLNVQQLAALLTQQAFSLSLNLYHRSPFMINAERQGFRHRGGKSDDITVVIGVVVLRKKQQQKKEDI